MKRKLLFGAAVFIMIITACNNPFFPEKKEKGLTPALTYEDPVIIDEDSNLSDVECIEGEEQILTVSVEGDEEDYSYQWYKNDENSNEGGTPIEGATDPSYKPPTDEEGTVYYYVVVTNKKSGKTTTSKPVKVTVYPEGTYIIKILTEANEGDDAVEIVEPHYGTAGSTITLNYTVADTALHNLLDFGGVTAAIAPVNSAGSGTRTYTINAADASNGVITIIAVFTHSNLELDPIAFTTTGPITKTYGNAPFTNAVAAGYSGSGAITYSSSDTDVATVDDTGQVTILKAGSAIITAEKAADEVYARAQISYTLTVNKAAGAAVTKPTVNGSPTINSITVNAVSLQTATGQSIEYAISTASNGTGLSAWRSGVTFTGLNAGTTYYVYARSASNTNYEAGTANVSAGITTVNPVVTFNSNGGSSVSSQTITAGALATRPSNPTRSGYTFGNWYQDAGLTTPYFFNTPVTANITLYARWLSSTTITEMSAKDMVWIAGGTFTMGSPSTEPNRYGDETQHSVTLNGFYMGKYEVTQEKYQAVVGSNPSSFSSSPQAGETQNKRPVERVTWYDAVEFCNKLSVQEGLQEVYTISGRTPASGYPITDATVTADFGKNGYRLPTEAEWEYACRAGTTTAYNTGNTISDNTGWYTSNSGNKTHEVGKKPANAWGLYDMHGNVWEWCWDWYGSYSSEAQTNPMGASSGSFRVARGGSWNNSAEFLRSAYRGLSNPNNRSNDLGFRLVRP